MAYHITITNNETGETVRDLDTNALVAVFDSGDTIGRSRGIAADINVVLNIAELLLVEYNELIELLPKEFHKRARKQTARKAKKELKKTR